jgi:hypothetical protein
VVQDPSTYSVIGTTLTFSAAPPSGTNNISVRYLGIPASGVTTTAYRTVTNFIATAGQTSFSVPSYTVGYIDVFRNGVRLVNAGSDFVATTGTTVVLNNACTVGDSVVTESFYVSSVLNAIPATAGAVNSTYLASSLTLTTPTLTSPTLTTPNIDSAQVATVSGTAPLYMCRAWVNFNGTGTVAIRASGNVSSITDNGVGDYTLNFTTAMPDANYGVNMSSVSYTNANYATLAYIKAGASITIPSLKTTTQLTVAYAASASAIYYDCSEMNVAIFR